MKKLKLTILITILTIMMFVLSGCTSTYYEEKEIDKFNTTDRFVEIKEWSDERGRPNYIVYDKETKVQYWKARTSYGLGLTVLLDAEGKPLLYEGE